MFKSNLIKWLRQLNMKAFLFFLALSSLVWLSVQFAKRYEETLQVPISFINQPKDKLIDVNSDKTLPVDINLTGFQILSLKVSRPRVTIDLNAVQTTSNRFVYNVSNNRVELASQLDIDPNKLEFLKDTVSVVFHQKATKLLPVSAITQISYAPGYASDGKIGVSPDSVKVSGKKELLDSLTVLETNPIEFSNVKESRSGKVSINRENLDDIALYNETVNYTLKVAKFTEGRLSVPVLLLNVPETVEVSIFPKAVTLIYQASLEDFSLISSSDFKVMQDFSALDGISDFFLPKIIKKPETVTNVKVLNPKIQYIIKQ